MKVETDGTKVLTLLEKKQRASASELGTDKDTMTQLESAGLVRKDGTIKTGSRGRPPVAWVIADGAEPEQAAEVEIQRPHERAQRKQKEEGASQSSIDKWLAEAKAKPIAKECQCIALMDTISPEELRHYQGCKTHWICSLLVWVRERART